MNCRECQDLITPAVDQCLGEDDRRRFAAHLEGCATCRRDYEMERRTKSLVQHRARMVTTPPDIAQALRAVIDREEASTRRVPWWQSIIPRSTVGPALGLAAVLLALIVLWPSPEEPAPSLLQASLAGPDIVRQSFANFERVLTGAIRPQLETSEPERVRSFFSGRTTFPVLVPLTRHCTLVGAVLNEYGGVPLAHTLYRHDGEIIYVYQTCWQTVRRGSPLVLPSGVQTAMEERGMYTETRTDGSTIAVWTDGRTLCAAVAHMDRDRLLECLEIGGGAGRP